MHIFSNFGKGGAEVGVSRLIETFSNSNDKHSICSISKNIRTDIVPDNTQVFTLEIEKADRLIFYKLYKLFKREKVTIAHANNLNVWTDVLFASKLAGTKCVETFHGIDTEKSQIPKYKKYQYKIISKFTDSITAVSRSALDLLSKEIGISDIVLINNGIDSERFRPVKENNFNYLKEEFKIGANAFLIGCVAGLREVKNHKGLLDAFECLTGLRPELFNEDKKCYLFLVGEGPLLNSLKEYANILGIAKHVLFLGQRQDINRILPSLDLFVMNSNTEGMSYSILEAMACGLPVAATDVGGNFLLVEDGVNGFLVPKDEPRLMAEAIIKLFDNHELKQKMGLNARKKIVDKFSLSNMTTGYFRLYEKL